MTDLPVHHDRRQHPRGPTAVAVYPLDGSPRMFAHDLGIGGMLVTTSTPRWPGALIRVRFRLPGASRSIRATCRVVTLVDVPRGVGLSLRFLALAPEAREMIARHVERTPATEPGAPAWAPRVGAWLERLSDDCDRLRALARG